MYDTVVNPGPDGRPTPVSVERPNIQSARVCLELVDSEGRVTRTWWYVEPGPLHLQRQQVVVEGRPRWHVHVDGPALDSEPFDGVKEL